MTRTKPSKFSTGGKIVHNVNARVVKMYGSTQGSETIVILWPAEHWLKTVGLEEYTPTEDDLSAFSGFLEGLLYTCTVERHDEAYGVWYEIGSHGLLVNPDDDSEVEELAEEALREIVID